MRSKQRVKDLGEVFTPMKTIREMVALLPEESWEEGKTFLEPTCGDGRFLCVILIEKIKRGHKPIEAISTLYGVDIMPDNIHDTKKNLMKVMTRFIDRSKWLEVVGIINNNIIVGDILA